MNGFLVNFEKYNREEESRVRKEEADLKLAEQAFDQFLQENDRFFLFLLGRL